MSLSSSDGFPANLLFGLILAGAGIFLAWHHPLGGVAASALFLMLFALGAQRFPFWLVIVPAAMPVIGLAPWSGWVSFEEFDLLVLALAGGAYLRLALAGRSSRFRQTVSGVSLGAGLLVAGFAISVLVSMIRGFDDAGGFAFGWYQGYYEPMNSVRLAKSLFLALFLLPLWYRFCQENQERAIELLALGMATGLGLASLAAIWERVAFTGLLNFSADYRTTALFWEMHVGGAAFDGFLALTVPFAVWALVRARATGRLIYLGGVLALAAYACLTTFSRGVYLAIPIGLALMAAFSIRHTSFKGAGLGRVGPAFSGLLIVSLFGGAAYWIFPTSGYRGLLALTVVVALFNPVNVMWSRTPGQIAWLVLLCGVVVAGVAALVSDFLPKGAYLIFAFGALLTVTALWKAKSGISSSSVLMGLAGYLSALAGCVLVAFHWGGEQAVVSMGVVSLVLLIATLATRVRPLQAHSGRWHVSLVSGILLVGFSLATFGGGQYMADRFGTSGQDLGARTQHWRAGLAQLGDIDWLLGKGLGRYPASHFFAAPPNEHPGGYRHIETTNESYLLMSGGQHVLGWGEMFRVTQRIIPGIAPYKVEFEAKADKAVGLHFEVCEKHLLYNAACVTKDVTVNSTPTGWQKIELKLDGAPPGSGAWFAPTLVAFSVAVGSQGGLVKLDNLALRDGTGFDLLNNGGFTNGMAHWFSSSDKHHMPWHMKSLFFHTLFDQGALGLGLLSLMVFAVFWRLTAGTASRYPLAPAIVASLSEFLVVGAFDSLLDVPRVAAMFYLILLIGLVAHVKAAHRPMVSENPNSPDPASQGT